jgi:hypothetical protein
MLVDMEETFTSMFTTLRGAQNRVLICARFPHIDTLINGGRNLPTLIDELRQWRDQAKLKDAFGTTACEAHVGYETNVPTKFARKERRGAAPLRVGLVTFACRFQKD